MVYLWNHRRIKLITSWHCQLFMKSFAFSGFRILRNILLNSTVRHLASEYHRIYKAKVGYKFTESLQKGNICCDYFDYLYQFLKYTFLHTLTSLFSRCLCIVRWEYLLLIRVEFICTFTLTATFITCRVSRRSCDISLQNSKPSAYYETSLCNLKCKLVRKLQN